MRFDVDRLLTMLSESARGSVRLVVVNFPHNPVSAIFASHCKHARMVCAAMSVAWGFYPCTDLK